MNKEIEVAARWWADCLRSPRPHDNGDFMQSALSTLVALAQQVDPVKVDLFEELLRAAILEQCEKYGWKTEEPDWGSYCRTVSVDYGPGPALATALRGAGINGLKLPIKTIMWVNPGVVKVAEGYRASPVVIWEGESNDKG